MRHEEEVDRIIDGLLDEIWVFAYNIGNSKFIRVDHLVKIDAEGNIISKTLCDKSLTNIVHMFNVNECQFIKNKLYLCQECIDILKCDPTKYGFEIDDQKYRYSIVMCRL